MSYYRVCPMCGANLDPGEVCDCRDKENTLVSATNTDEGKVETKITSYVSTSNNTPKQEEKQV